MNPRLTKLLTVIMYLLTIAYLFGLFSGYRFFYDLNYGIRRPLYSDYVDLSRSNVFEWKIDSSRLVHFNGEAMVVLHLNRMNLREVPESRNKVALRLKIEAFGLARDGTVHNRLISNWYYKTNEPFGPNVTLGTSTGLGSLEYTLGGIKIGINEDIVIRITIQEPDLMLMTGRPRLKLWTTHGPGEFQLNNCLAFLMEFGIFLIIIFFLISQVWLVCRSKKLE